MSHFSVAVIHSESEDIETLLAPYQENNMGDCPEEYMELQIEVEKGQEEQYRKDELDSDYWKKPEQYAKREYYLKLPIEDFMKEFGGLEKNEKGEWGYMTNPNSRWDWYQIGGRWKDMLKLKKEAKPIVKGERTLLDKAYISKEGWCDSARIKDIDFEGMLKDNTKEYERLWEKAQNEKEQERAWRYGIRKDDTKESYVKRSAYFSTFSILMDDDWEDIGNWGQDDTGQKEKFLKIIEELIKERPDDVLTIVDCHT